MVDEIKGRGKSKKRCEGGRIQITPQAQSASGRFDGVSGGGSGDTPKGVDMYQGNAVF